jgi:glutathione S-transferase
MFISTNGFQLQPPILPRPDLAAVGTSYRRIPVVAIGRDIYNDTRLIIEKLEKMYPSQRSISSSTRAGQAQELLLQQWVVDGGVFARAAQLIPSSMPLLRDPKFTKDREEYTGRPWSKEAIDRSRPEALVEIRAAFDMLETLLLADGKEWIAETEGPGLADIEGKSVSILTVFVIFSFLHNFGLRSTIGSSYSSMLQDKVC